MRGQVAVDDEAPVPVFTGAELALADALILVIKVLSMHGAIDGEAIDTVFSDMENRYRKLKLNTAAAMADYLREHAIGDDTEMTLTRLRPRVDRAPEGSA